MQKRKNKLILIIAILFVSCFFIGVPQVFADTTADLLPVADGGNDSASWKNEVGAACNATNCYTSVADTSGASCVNSDGDTTYIISVNTVNSNQTFDLNESSIPDNSTITQVNVSACTKIVQGGATFQLRNCVDGSCTNSGTNITPPASYNVTTFNFSTNFIKNASTDLEIGIVNTTANKNLRASKFSAVITYTLPSDTTAPAAISNLALSSPSNSAMTVSWTAPGDDGSTGTATSYDLRYSTSAITSDNFSSATQVSGEPTPLVTGTSQSMTVTGLSPSTTYYFAIKTADEVPNWSLISNIPSLATTATPDTTAPAAVSNLSASNAGGSSIDLSWTAPGDDDNTGTATSYDMRYSTSAITDDNFSSATAVSGAPTPQIAGTSQSMTVSGLLASTTYFFAMKTSDEVPNTSAFSNVPSLATLASGEEAPSPSPTPVPIPGGGLQITATFSGQAYPGSTIELLRKSVKDELYTILPDTSISIKEDGTFEISQTGLIREDYLFALRVKDKDNRKTTIFFNADLIYQSNFTVKNIFIPPTVELKNTILSRTDDLQLFGYAAANNTLEIEVDGIIQKETARSDETGYYMFNTSIGPLSTGTHYVKIRQIDKDGKKSDFSPEKIFKKSLLFASRADFNNDGKVNITDWSIFLFRWGSPDQELRSTLDLDGNGKVDIFDLSIFLKAIAI